MSRESLCSRAADSRVVSTKRARGEVGGNVYVILEGFLREWWRRATIEVARLGQSVTGTDGGFSAEKLPSIVDPIIFFQYVRYIVNNLYSQYDRLGLNVQCFSSKVRLWGRF